MFMDEKLPNFISGVVHALSFYDAIPQYLVPDNLKTAVTRQISVWYGVVMPIILKMVIIWHMQEIFVVT